MLIYLALIYVIFRIINFLIVHRGQSKQVLGKMIGFLILEIVLVIIGIMTVVPVIFGGIGNNVVLAYSVLIVGVICLIASGRVGMHISKLAKGTVDEISNVNLTVKKQFTSAKILVVLSFLALIFAWPFYQALFKYWAALIYAVSLLCAILAIRYANKSRSDQYIKKSSIWSVIIISCFIGILSVFMLFGIAMKI